MIAAADFKGLCALYGHPAQVLVARPDVTAGLMVLLDDPEFAGSEPGRMLREIHYAQAEGFTVNLQFDAAPPPDR